MNTSPNMNEQGRSHMEWVRHGICLRVGALGLAAICVLAASIPLVGKQGNAFATAQGAEQAGAIDAPALPSEVEKQQVVYVKESATGGQEGVYVVNAFDARAAVTVVDAAPYALLMNLTDSQELVVEEGEVAFDVVDDATFRYQGDMAANTPTPWSMDISYTLNGHAVAPEDLVGADGHIGMTLAIVPNERCGGNFAKNYLLQITGVFDDDIARNISAPDATVAQAGDATQLSYMLFPGKTATYRIDLDAQDFAFDGFQMIGTPLSLALDVDAEELGDATKELNELADAVALLNDGAQRVSDGASSARKGASELAGSSASLREGVVDVRGALGSLSSGASELAGAFGASLVEGVETLAEGSKAYKDGLEAKALELDQQAQGTASFLESRKEAYERSVSRFTEAYSQAFAQAIMEQMQAGATTPDAAEAASQALANSSVQTAQASMREALEALVSAQATSAGAAAASSALEEAAAGYAPLDAGLQGLVDPSGESGIHALARATDELSSGLSSTEKGVLSLEEGIGSYTEGIDSLDSGLGELAGGANALSDGMSELYASTRGIDQKLIDGIRDEVQEFLDPDFQPTDFVTGSSEILRVQFVYKTAGLIA